jgi:hypothetical protein
MPTRAIAFAVTSLFASIAFGQTPAEQSVDRTFYFTQAKTAQEFQETAVAIRGITNIRDAVLDPTKMSLALRGTADQIALAQWLYNELDQTTSTTSREYRVPSNSDDIVRVFYLTKVQSPQELVEASTLVRSIANIRQAFIDMARRAVVIRATSSEVALSDWLFAELDKPSLGQYQASDGRNGENVVRVFYLKHAATEQDFMEAVTLTRSIANLRQVFTYTSQRSVAMRGTAGQLALAEWLINQIDKPAKEQTAAVEYNVPESRDDVVRVFYVTRAGSPQDLMTIAKRIQTEANVPRPFVYGAPKAIAVRGTSEQVALAEQLSRQQ